MTQLSDVWAATIDALMDSLYIGVREWQMQLFSPIPIQVEKKRRFLMIH